MTLKEFLSTNDRFAANSGCVLEEIGDGYARATLPVASVMAASTSRWPTSPLRR